MRRDVCYYFASDVQTIYNAYLTAATNAPFKRGCAQTPHSVISFGLNYSMKYNMNGGSCTIHFMPYNNGTAVNLRFSIVQLAGARYEKYANDLTNAATAVCNVHASRADIPISVFTTAEAAPSVPQPAAAPQVTAPQPAAPQGAVCPKCGRALNADDAFCGGCGTKVNAGRFCTKCGAAANADSRFCCVCGNKLS